MDITSTLLKTRDVVEKAKDIAIVIHESPTADSIGSALSLFLGLISLGKKVSVSCPDAITVEHSSYIGVNKISKEISLKNFVISLDYKEGSIEKVSYNIEDNMFNLVIEPRVGYEPFTSEKVHFSHAGSNASVIFTIDTVHLGGFKNIYENDKDLFGSATIINIDNHINNTKYGSINIVDPDSSTTVEIIAQLISTLGIHLNEDIATNILNALFETTNNFQNPHVTGRTFELAALCVKSGGKKFGRSVESRNQAESPDTAKVNPLSNLDSEVKTQPVPSKVYTPTSNVPQNDFSRSEDKRSDRPEKVQKQQTPPDWLRPKIFRSSNNPSHTG